MEVNDSTYKKKLIQPAAHYVPLVVVAIFVALFFTTFTTLFDRWIKWDEGLSHGLLVVVAFLILLFKTLPWHNHTQPRWLFSLLCAALALGSLTWFLFHTINISVLEQLVLLPLLILCCAAIFGIKTAWQHRILLLLPIFAVPLWDHLNDLLLHLSTIVVGDMVRMIQMPALIEGNSIFIPYGHILIADGCSGLRYFVIALVIGYIIAYLNHYGERRILMTLMIAALIGLVANWVRIFILILVGYQTQMQSRLMADHEYFGWILFALLCLPAIYFAPVVRKARTQNAPANLHAPHLAVPLIALALGPFAALLFNPTPTPDPWQNRLPHSLTPVSAARMPILISAPEQGHRENAVLRMDAIQVFVQIDQYQRQHKKDKLVPYIARLYNPEDWSQVSSEPFSQGPGKLTLLRHKSGLRRVAQVQWFDLGPYQTGSLNKAKLLQIPMLVQREKHFAIVTLQSECQLADCHNEVASIAQVAQQLNSGDFQ